MKLTDKGVAIVADIDAREVSDMPVKELTELRRAFAERGMGFISLLYLMPQGTSILFPKVVEDRLLQKEHAEVLDSCINTLELQLELFRDLKRGIVAKTDGNITSLANPLETKGKVV